MATDRATNIDMCEYYYSMLHHIPLHCLLTSHETSVTLHSRWFVRVKNVPHRSHWMSLALLSVSLKICSWIHWPSFSWKGTVSCGSTPIEWFCIGLFQSRHLARNAECFTDSYYSKSHQLLYLFQLISKFGMCLYHGIPLLYHGSLRYGMVWSGIYCWTIVYQILNLLMLSGRCTCHIGGYLWIYKQDPAFKSVYPLGVSFSQNLLVSAPRCCHFWSFGSP
jgi:hypothetical protein